jgi:hypothetical protein
MATAEIGFLVLCRSTMRTKEEMMKVPPSRRGRHGRMGELRTEIRACSAYPQMIRLTIYCLKELSLSSGKNFFQELILN